MLDDKNVQRGSMLDKILCENKHDLKAHLDIIISLCEVILASHKTIEVDIN